MSTELAFDEVATDYDEEWTNTSVGQAQRSQVWKYLDRELAGRKNLNILELNCGTGEDAAFLCKKGHKVTATDVSQKMLDVARSKFSKSEYPNLEFEKLDLNDLKELDDKYDLIFSNFGGLNCIENNRLDQGINILKSSLEKDGQIILVLISRFCLSESLYMLFTLRFTQIFRRSKRNQSAKLGSQKIPIYYYKKKEIDSFVRRKADKKVGIGFLVPPSYLHSKLPGRLINFLNVLDKGLQSFFPTSSLSDHVLLKYRF